MAQDYYDAIVVGAGPGGASAALVMARNGMSVLMLERGKQPGTKTMFGGTIYSQALQDLIPEYWQEAPVERAIVTDSLWLMDVTSAVQLQFTGLDFGKAPFNKFSALRRRFDPWLAQKAVEAGAELRTSSCVARCLKYGRAVCGVELTTGEKIYGNLVILADGANSFLAQQLGMLGRIYPESVTAYVKEVIELPAGVIEDRFQLEPGEGATYGMVGYPTAGAIGKAGIWTNKDSISLMVGAYLNEMMAKRLNPFDLLVRFKRHPLVRRLIAGGKTVDYLAHIIPKGGYKDMPQLYDDGVLVVGDAAVMISGRHGTDLAMLTGRYAGETAIQAKAANNFTKRELVTYKAKVDRSWFMQDIRATAKHSGYYSKYSDADYLLSRAANRSAYRMFSEVQVSDADKKRAIFQELRNLQPLGRSLADVYQGLLNWRVL